MVKMMLLVLICTSLVLSSCARSEQYADITVVKDEADNRILSEKEVNETIEGGGDYLTKELDTHQHESVKKEENELKATGGANLCEVHATDFHTFSGEMIKYVGEKQFNEWLESCAGKSSGIEGCIHYANIYRFIEHFDFPKKVFEKLYYGTIMFYFYDYDIDLIYDADASIVSQYYMSYADREEEREKYSSLGEIKIGIAERAMMSTDEKMKEFFETYCKDKTIVEWSIADFVKTTAIDKQDLQVIIGDITVREYPGMTIVLNCFDFDYDVLYDSSELMTVRTTKENSVLEKHNEDLMFCRQPQLNVAVVDEDVSVD